MLQNLGSEMIETVGPYIPRVVAAMAVLVAGWLLVYLLAQVVRRALLRTDLDDRLAKWVAGPELAGKVEVEVVASRTVFYLGMVFVLVACFQVLGLTLVTEPLNVMLTQLLEFVPRLLSAALLVGVAWLLATGIRAGATRVVAASNIEKRVGEDTGGADSPLPQTVGEALYWFTFLLFLPGILGALALDGMMQPVQDMLSRIIGFLPNLFTAALTLFVGWLVARMVQRVATGFMAAAGLDALADRVRLSEVLGGQRASAIAGVILYVLIFIPVLISAMTALGLDAITAPLSSMLETMLISIPTVFASILLIAVAYGLGRIVSELVSNVLSSVGFDTVLAKVGIGRPSGEGAATRKPSALVGSLVLTAILLLASMEAASLLGFESLSLMVAEFLTVAGHVVLGIVLFGIGLFGANFVADMIQAANTPNSHLLARLARVAIMILAGAISLRQMGLANEIVTLAFAALVGAIAVALAVAFGLGGRDAAAEQLGRWRGKLEQ